MLFLAINPEVNGAISTYHTELKTYAVYDMPKRVTSVQSKKFEIDCQGLLGLVIELNPKLILIEERKTNNGFEMMNYGLILGITSGVQQEVIVVKRKSWQRYFSVKDNRNKLFTLAKDLFPEADFTGKDYSKAVALLIAKYGVMVKKSVFEGTLLP